MKVDNTCNKKTSCTEITAAWNRNTSLFISVISQELFGTAPSTDSGFWTHSLLGCRCQDPSVATSNDLPSMETGEDEDSEDERVFQLSGCPKRPRKDLQEAERPAARSGGDLAHLKEGWEHYLDGCAPQCPDPLLKQAAESGAVTAVFRCVTECGDVKE